MALMAELMLQAFVRALAWARVAAWACRLGAGRAWCQGGLASMRRGRFCRLVFLELFLHSYYLISFLVKTTMNSAISSQPAMRSNMIAYFQ